jgi:hypothetical protein
MLLTCDAEQEPLCERVGTVLNGPARELRSVEQKNGCSWHV